MAAESQAPLESDSEGRLAAFREARAAGGPGVMALGEALLKDYPDTPGVRGALARMKLSDGDHAGALELAHEELKRRPGQPKLLKLAAIATEATQGGEAALPLLEALADSGADDGWANFVLAKRALDTVDGREALHRLELAERAGYSAPNITLDRCRAAVMIQDAELARRYFAELSAEQQGRMEKQIKTLEDRLGTAANLRRKGRLHALTSNQLKAWGAERGAGDFDRGGTRLFVTESGDMLGERVEGSRSMLMVFGGLRDLVGAALPRFDKVLRARRINTLYLSDPRRLMLLSGLPTFGDHAESLAGLRGLMQRWGVEELFCLGVSAGGYAAIAYGVDLGARRILTLAAPTTLVGPVRQVDHRASIMVDRIVARVPGRELDLRKVLESAADPPEIINYYAEDSPEDVAHAENIRGLPTVRLETLGGRIGHAVPHHLEASGDYPKVIDELLAGRLASA